MKRSALTLHITLSLFFFMGEGGGGRGGGEWGRREEHTKIGLGWVLKTLIGEPV